MKWEEMDEISETFNMYSNSLYVHEPNLDISLDLSVLNKLSEQKHNKATADLMHLIELRLQQKVKILKIEWRSSQK